MLFDKKKNQSIIDKINVIPIFSQENSPIFRIKINYLFNVLFKICEFFFFEHFNGLF